LFREDQEISIKILIVVVLNKCVRVDDDDDDVTKVVRRKNSIIELPNPFLPMYLSNLYLLCEC
jgi:hypothetical protein